MGIFTADLNASNAVSITPDQGVQVGHLNSKDQLTSSVLISPNGNIVASGTVSANNVVANNVAANNVAANNVMVGNSLSVANGATVDMGGDALRMLRTRSSARMPPTRRMSITA